MADHRQHHAAWQRDDSREEPDRDYLESMNRILVAVNELDEQMADEADPMKRRQRKAIDELRVAFGDQVNRMNSARQWATNSFWAAWLAVSENF